jgi:nickel transport protein
MIPFTRLFLLLGCFSFFLLPQQALAHKIHVFAWVSGNTVTVESNFSGNRPLINGAVTVQDAQSKTVLLEGRGDKKGIFTFSIPTIAIKEAMDLLIVVAGSEGHQNQWRIPAEEYLPDQAPATSAVHSIAAPKTDSAELNRDELKQMLEELLKEELGPIKRSLARAEDRKPDFRDIMGGIGYLLGLAGLIAWLRNRRHQNTADK